MGLISEFKEFALKGNVMDMAIGVIIGGAFGKIVNSVINDVIMPVVSMAGKADFSNYYLGLNETVKAAAEAGKPLKDARDAGPTLAYGAFVTEVINFLILAACIFLIVKMMNSAKKRFEKEKAAAPPPAPPADVTLLTEIRDLLKK